MTRDPVFVVKASFRRCCEAEGFFAAFYDNFFAACPAARPMFAHTDFDRQHRLLQHGIGLLFNFNHQPASEPNILSRVAERHSRRDLDVDPSLYPSFLESLIGTARKYDPEFSAEIEMAWRDATAKGIAYMQSRY